MIRTPSRVESPRVQFSKNVSFKTLHKLRTFDIYYHLRSNRASPTEVFELIEELRHEVEEYHQRNREQIMMHYIHIYALTSPSILLGLIRVDKANVDLMDFTNSAIQLLIEKTSPQLQNMVKRSNVYLEYN
jgi:hypothetical protein